MDQYEAVMKLLMEMVKSEPEKHGAGQDDGAIPVGVSNRHVHLSQGDLDALFGAGYELTKMKDLSQPGQYACKETVTVCGPKGAIEKVRILGPVRGKTQVEILAGDCFKLGVKAPARLSGDLDGTPGVTLVGPKGSVQTKSGLMAAQRHIHMLPEDAARFGVHDGRNPEKHHCAGNSKLRPGMPHRHGGGQRHGPGRLLTGENHPVTIILH